MPQYGCVNYLNIHIPQQLSKLFEKMPVFEGSIFLLNLLMFIHFWETAHKQGRDRERGRQNPTQAPAFKLLAQS